MSNINFWEDDDGEEIEQNDSFDSGGGADFEVIPKNTNVQADIESVSIESFKNASEIEYINVQWTISRPEVYNNRRIFQKIKIYGDDPTQKSYKEEKQPDVRKKAKTMLAAIDKICSGGKLFALRQEPTEENLQRYLVGKTANLNLQVWSIKCNDGEPMTGNWVSSVSSPKAGQPAKAKTASTPKKESIVDDDLESDIPFN